MTIIVESYYIQGFLWADVVNTVSIATRSCRWAIASLLIIELKSSR